MAGCAHYFVSDIENMPVIAVGTNTYQMRFLRYGFLSYQGVAHDAQLRILQESSEAIDGVEG